MNGMPFSRQATCVSIHGRALLIEGAPGTGKSSLALTLMDRGARLVGDDSLLLDVSHDSLLAHPHPNTRGLLEVRNLGLLPFPCVEAVPVALVLRLDADAPRHVEGPGYTAIGGIALPLLHLWPHDAVLPLKAELALERYGLSF